MAISDGEPFVLNLAHPEIMRSILAQILETGDVLGRDEAGRTVLAVAVDDWLFDALGALDADLEDLEPEPLEDDDGDSTGTGTIPRSGRVPVYPDELETERPDDDEDILSRAKE